ncbi:MAG TPA: hypothetical protein VJ672_03745, partial [Gemmatimonadaceae bacterium]|nr:hypothetical protein [Gemmatimonadaceae bacterium]
EPAHLASLTPAQRDDLRLWHGRVNLLDRIKAARWYGIVTVAMWGAGLATFGASISEGIPPGVLAPIIPIYMSQKLWRRGRSLKEAGVRLRRVFLMPRTKWVLPAPAPHPTDQQLAKLAPRDVLEGPHGRSIRRAAEERQAILALIAGLSKEDRAMLPDLAPTVNALVDRVANLAQTLHRLDQSIDPGLGEELEARIATAASESEAPEGQRRLALLERQRDTLRDIAQRRAALMRQLDTAGLALINLRLDLIKVRSSGLQSALSTVSSATQDARALSREIDVMLDAAAEAKSL